MAKAKRERGKVMHFADGKEEVFGDLRKAHGVGSFSKEFDTCDLCHGARQIWVDREYEFAGRKVTGLTELVPCPRCGEAYCKTCGNGGWIKYNVPQDHPYFGQLFPCPDCKKGQSVAARVNVDLLAHAQLPRRYADLTFQTWEQLPPVLKQGKELAYAAIYNWVQASNHGFWVYKSDIYKTAGVKLDKPYVDTVRNSIVLTGDFGVGKTGLAAAAVNALIAQGRAPLYIRLSDVLKNLRKAMDEREDKEGPEDMINRIRNHPILIIDEYATQNTTDWQIDQSEDIIRGRHGLDLPTVITTNLTREEFRQRWAGTSSSALFEMSHEIEVGGYPIRDEGDTLTQKGLFNGQ